MDKEIIREGETAVFQTILKDENDVIIPQASLTALTLTFKNKKTSEVNYLRLGKDDYIDCGLDSSLKITGAITMEAWINLQASIFPDSSTDWDIFHSATYLASGFLFGVDGTTGKLIYETNQSGATQLSQSSGTLTKNVWYHIVVVRSGAVATFYINGSISAREILGSHIDPTIATIPFKLGSTTNLSLDGFIRDARIYNRVLTDTEILERYNLQTDIQNGLVSEWKLQGNYKDSKGLNHGMPTGTIIYRNFGIINNRYYQDVRGGGGGTNNHTIGVSDGLLSWNMQVADNPIIDSILPEGDLEEHVAEYNWTAGTKIGRHVIPIWVKRSVT